MSFTKTWSVNGRQIMLAVLPQMQCNWPHPCGKAKFANIRQGKMNQNNSINRKVGRHFCFDKTFFTFHCVAECWPYLINEWEIIGQEKEWRTKWEFVIFLNFRRILVVPLFSPHNREQFILFVFVCRKIYPMRTTFLPVSNVCIAGSTGYRKMVAFTLQILCLQQPQ